MKHSAQLLDDQNIFLEINRLLAEIARLYPSEISLESEIQPNQTQELCVNNLDMRNGSLGERIDQSVQLTSQANQILLQAADLLMRKSL